MSINIRLIYDLKFQFFKRWWISSGFFLQDLKAVDNVENLRPLFDQQKINECTLKYRNTRWRKIRREEYVPKYNDNNKGIKNKNTNPP